MHQSQVMEKISVYIVTKDRFDELVYTIHQLSNCGFRTDQIYVVDDGSKFFPVEKLITLYPGLHVEALKVSKGYIFHRNNFLNSCTTPYAFFLDDDAHPVFSIIGEVIEREFQEHSDTALISCPIFWTRDQLDLPADIHKKRIAVNDFVGCGHIWRISAWKTIKDYPEWLLFYGEEKIASIQLHRAGWNIIELGSAAVQHRVSIALRKQNEYYFKRELLSFSNGLSIYIVYYPIIICLKYIVYVIFQKLKKGKIKLIFYSFLRLITILPFLRRYDKRMTKNEYSKYQQVRNKVYFEWI